MKKPNRFLAPIVIAGITVGFLASAYKFIFAKPSSKQGSSQSQTVESSASDSKERH